jgi:signal transduction histidine kinase
MLNAAEAIDGHGRIAVSRSVRAARGDKAEIRVRDSGCGIPAN